MASSLLMEGGWAGCTCQYLNPHTRGSSHLLWVGHSTPFSKQQVQTFFFFFCISWSTGWWGLDSNLSLTGAPLGMSRQSTKAVKTQRIGWVLVAKTQHGGTGLLSHLCCEHTYSRASWLRMVAICRMPCDPSKGAEEA